MRKCFKCNRSHNTILHLTTPTSEEYKENTSSTARANHMESDQSASSTTAILVTTAATQRRNCDVERLSGFSQVLLSTSVVMVRNDGKVIKARALLDSGSQTNFISENLCQLLDLKSRKVEHIIKGVGKTITNVTKQVKVQISSCYSNFSSDISCLVMPSLICKLPNVSFNKNILKIPSGFNLADPDFNVEGEIDILLGSDVFWRIMRTGYEILGSNLPILKNTALGWVVAGKVGPNLSECKKTINCLSVLETVKSIDNTITKFWELEEVNSKTKIFSSQKSIVKIILRKRLRGIRQEDI